MNDKTLLTLAAKAAGLTTSHKWNAQRLEMTPPVPSLVVHRDGELVSTGWNPLADDGDALRLAVELRFDLNFQRTGRERIVQVYSSRIGKWVSETYRDNDDSCAVTRKVIVLAAASIGKTGEPT